MTEIEKLSAVYAAVQSAIPSALADAGIDDFEDYLDDTPSDDGRRQFGVWLADAEDQLDEESTSFWMQAQLPGIHDPKFHVSAIWAALKSALKPSIIHMIDREMTYVAWYPGEKPKTGSSSIIDFEVRFTRPLDDQE